MVQYVSEMLNVPERDAGGDAFQGHIVGNMKMIEDVIKNQNLPSKYTSMLTFFRIPDLHEVQMQHLIYIFHFELKIHLNDHCFGVTNSYFFFIFVFV